MTRVIRDIICHQTDTPTATVETIRRYHMTPEAEGGPPGGPWSDIGYHYVLQPDGTWRKGRPNSKVGAHCRGDNADSIGICMVGEGDALPLDVGYMTTEMFNGLLVLTRIILGAYADCRELRGHREYPSGREQGKSCPGFDVEILRSLLLHGRRPR